MKFITLNPKFLLIFPVFIVVAISNRVRDVSEAHVDGLDEGYHSGYEISSDSPSFHGCRNFIVVTIRDRVRNVPEAPAGVPDEVYRSGCEFSSDSPCDCLI